MKHHPINAVCVYIAQAGDMVKVGVTQDPAARAKTMQTSQADEVTMPWLCILNGRGAAMKAEKRIQRLLSRRHVRGEWFNVDIEEAVELAESVVHPGWRKRRSFAMPLDEALERANDGSLTARIKELDAISRAAFGCPTGS